MSAIAVLLLCSECAVSSLGGLAPEVLLFLFFLSFCPLCGLIFLFSFFRVVEELVHGISGLLGFPSSCVVHCFIVPVNFFCLYVLRSIVADITSRLFPFTLILKDRDSRCNVM